MLERRLRLPWRPGTSFFLWGPRQTGKSTLLRSSYPRARVIDLLAAREFVRFSRDPGLLGEEIEASKDRFVVIDEIQKTIPGSVSESS